MHEGSRAIRLAGGRHAAPEAHRGILSTTSVAASIELVADGLPVPLRNLRYLVVDDDADQRFLVARTLNRMGMAEVVEASSGRTALEALANADCPVDVVISDLQMPDM